MGLTKEKLIRKEKRMERDFMYGMTGQHTKETLKMTSDMEMVCLIGAMVNPTSEIIWKMKGQV